MSESMYLKKGKFSHELALQDIKVLQNSICLIASDTPVTLTHINSDDVSENVELTELPLDFLLEQQQKQIALNIARSFIKGNKFEERVSEKSTYEKLLKLIENEEFYLNKTFSISDSLSLFESLKSKIEEELSTIKSTVFPRAWSIS
jgi:hypothetical protein